MVSYLMLIVVERRETFHYYYPMGVHPPGDLTVTHCASFFKFMAVYLSLTQAETRVRPRWCV